MVASLCWKNNEWVGLSMACAISELIGSLNELLLPNLKHSLPAASCGSSFHGKTLFPKIDFGQFLAWLFLEKSRGIAIGLVLSS